MAELKTILPDGFLRRHDDKQHPLAADNRFAIESVVKRILWAEDARDMEAMRTLLTDDFVQQHPFGDVEGKEGMVGFVLSQPEVSCKACGALSHAPNALLSRRQRKSYLLLARAGLCDVH